MKCALIDNYDSFTFNLKAQLLELGIDLEVFRNDKLSIEQLDQFDFLVFSPGPSTPVEAGLLKEIIQTYKYTKPMLGICLGMQAMGEVFGGRLNLLGKPLHGVSKEVHHFGDDLFKGVAPTFMAARYHSWVINKKFIPHELEVIAVSDEKELMAIKHVDLPIYGFQFHPESVLTDCGMQLMSNFVQLVNQLKSEKVIGKAV